MKEGDKEALGDFWDEAPCGHSYATGMSLRSRLESQADARYSLEPYIAAFAGFDGVAGEDLLEIGVGMGADHVRFAEAGPRSLTGVDLSPRSMELTSERLGSYGLGSNLSVADAEHLPFEDESFSFVYSWGVLHHSPNTEAAVEELYRVLRPGGRARVMMYHRGSIVGYCLWARYALLRGNPGRSLEDVYAHHLESPGTKAYTPQEACELFGRFRGVDVQVQLSFADLMRGEVGGQHGSGLVSFVKRFWPRRLIERWLSTSGLYLLIEARK